MLAGRTGALFVVMLIIVAASFTLALALGSADISFIEALQALRGEGPEKVQSLVTDLRLPRALTAFTGKSMERSLRRRQTSLCLVQAQYGQLARNSS